MIRISVFTRLVGSLLCILCMMTACNSENEGLPAREMGTIESPQPSISDVASAIASPPLFRVSGSPRQKSLSMGMEAEIQIVFENLGKEEMMLHQFPPKMEVIRKFASGKIEVIRTFAPGDKERVLVPGEEAYILRWDQRNSDGHQVNPGYYVIRVAEVYVDGPEIKATEGLFYEFGFPVAKVLIEYPQGALVKKVDVNQSQKMGTLNVTLAHVIMSTTGAYAELIISPRNLSESSPLSTIPIPESIYLPDESSCSAHLIIDDYTEQQAIMKSLKLTEQNTVMILEFDPVPADAKEINIVITQLMEWHGLWNIELPIQ